MSDKEFNLHINGSFSQTAIAFDTLNQATDFNKAMHNPQLKEYSDDLMKKVFDDSSKFLEYKSDIRAEKAIKWYKYEPNKIDVSWTDITVGSCILSASAFVVYFITNYND